MKKNTIILAGGGTGGHAGPVLAVYKELKKHDDSLDIFVVGVGSEEEKKFFDAIPTYKVVRSGKIHRYLTLKNILEVLNFIIGFFQAVFLIMKTQPKVVFSKGGYASLPIVFAAKLFKVPYFIHESDIRMGKVNQIMSKGAKKVFVLYPVDFYTEIKKTNLIQSGPLLREGFAKEKESSKKLFGFDNDKPIIFVTGGSQGSLSLSQNFIGAAKELLRHYNIIHQAGKHSIEIAKKFYDQLDPEMQKSYYAVSFLEIVDGKDMMLEAINVSDLIVTRAGSTIVELAIKKKPMILVPWKHAAQDHQTANADYFVKNDSAVVISDDEITSDKLLNEINELFSNDQKLERLAKNAGKLFPNNGTELIAETILKEFEAK